ncbi:major capsid protein [Stutzerimonas frequens]|uniref:major capsid protein n=1 Tax=Stutzerimonas frequens TaxID=2968969 RepID=UPI001909CF32|nr:major capsid protein [Stutzerimonas frequens]MBK3871600.1 hypothetical protein [Stutzerimonas frequens]MBK3909938.1 hypothetical protein [Stutzerimonas frequens]
MKLRNFATKVGAFTTLMIGTSYALADAAAAEASMKAAEADVNTIGWAGIGLLIAAVLFKYIRRAA